MCTGRVRFHGCSERKKKTEYWSDGPRISVQTITTLKNAQKTWTNRVKTSESISDVLAWFGEIRPCFFFFERLLNPHIRQSFLYIVKNKATVRFAAGEFEGGARAWCIRMQQNKTVLVEGSLTAKNKNNFWLCFLFFLCIVEKIKRFLNCQFHIKIKKYGSLFV